MNGHPLLFLPIVDWQFRRQRPQQLARCFARAGHRVYYARLRLAPEATAPEPLLSGVWRVTLAGDPGLDPYRDRLGAPAADAALRSLASLAPEHSLAGCWVVAHLPFWRPLAERARAAFGGALLFDCMDDFSAFGDHADLGDEEAALARAADLVTVTSQALHDRLAPLARRCRMVRNGCDPEHFGPALARPPRPPGSRPVVGFFGGIHDWFDGELVAALAARRPDWDFWLVGGTFRGDIEALRGLANVALLGESSYEGLPRVVSRFDVGIIPFKRTPLTLATNPVKVYEMLAAGLPVVAVELPELQSLQPLVVLAATPAEFEARIAEALAEPPAARTRRRDFALRQSWVERFLELRRAMDEVRPPVPAAATPVVPTLAALGVADLQAEPGDRLRRVDELVAAAREAERTIGGARAELEAGEAERRSLIEQRERVEAEARRLRGELERVEGERRRGEEERTRLEAERQRLEAERRGLEAALRRVTASRWWRLGRFLYRLLPHRATKRGRAE